MKGQDWQNLMGTADESPHPPPPPPKPLFSLESLYLSGLSSSNYLKQ